MRRTISLVGLLTLTLMVSGCACFVALVGEDVYHEHQDGVAIGGTKPITGLNQRTGPALKPYWVGEFRLEKVWESTYSAHVLGGVRLQNDTRLKWPYFWEVTGGLTHFPGQNLLSLHPNVGFMIPRAGKDPRFFFRLGLPIYFFTAVPKVGTEFTVGFMLPQRK